MYCEYKIEIMLRNIVMTVLLLQNYQLLELQLDQMIGKAVTEMNDSFDYRSLSV